MKGGRKLIVVGIFTTAGVALSYFGKLDQITSDFLIYMTGAFVMGNVGEHVTNILKKS